MTLTATTGACACPLCGAANGCRAADGAGCWCRQASFSPALLAAAAQRPGAPACICRRCAAPPSEPETQPRPEP